MVSLNILIVHGIGNCRPGYSLALQRGLKREFAFEVARILGSWPAGDDHLVFREVVWEEVLAKNEGKLKTIFEEELSRRRRRGTRGLIKDAGLIVIAFILFGFIFENPFVIVLLLVGIFSLASQLSYKLRTAFAAESVCDIVAYRNKVNYRQIHSCVEEGVRELGAGTAPFGITFISHSLGTVISSDFVYDAQEGLNNRTKVFRCSNFFTLGSPLALFSLQCGPEGFSKPITIEDERGRWVNILDPDDPIAYKLKGLNDAYDKAVSADCEVNMGLFGISHLKYWDNRVVHRIIVRKLAIDWISANGLLEKERLAQLYRAYDAAIGQV